MTVGDLEDPLPSGWGEFDVVTAFNSVQYAADPVAVVKNISQVASQVVSSACRSGGRPSNAKAA